MTHLQLINAASLLSIIAIFVGIIIVYVDAFQASTTWGLLCCAVPFAVFVFVFKFWERRKWTGIGTGLTVVGLIMFQTLMTMLKQL